MMSVTAFAPATVSNVACGFDVLGFALHEPGDQVTATWAANGVHITDISGDDGRLPRIAGVAAERPACRGRDARVRSRSSGITPPSGLGSAEAQPRLQSTRLSARTATETLTPARRR
jgi:homoserine kinase